MNKREFKCVEILTDLIENHGMVGIKTSFEDEGALFNETVRLKQVCNQAGTKITLKIGGPEAIRDIKDSLIIGVKGIVAPMVESEFGLKKFVNSARTYIQSDALSSTNLYINIESKTAIKTFMLSPSVTNLEAINRRAKADKLPKKVLISFSFVMNFKIKPSKAVTKATKTKVS